jgi:hypothetical protein
MLRKKKSRPSEEEYNPLSSLANLADVMFVFSVGLIVALMSSLNAPMHVQSIDVTRGKAINEVPQIESGAGTGFQEMGTVYKDPKTGKLIMIQQ